MTGTLRVEYANVENPQDDDRRNNERDRGLYYLAADVPTVGVEDASNSLCHPASGIISVRDNRLGHSQKSEHDIQRRQYAT